jgi:hypothetical protein
MKSRYILFFSALVLVFASCKKVSEDPTLINTWKLMEVLADPGDGSGTFQPVTSDKTISFFADGTVTSNGNLCQMSTETGTGSAGTYSEAEMSITPDNCGFAPFVMTYELDGANLILSYPCFEPCREKYVVVE